MRAGLLVLLLAVAAAAADEKYKDEVWGFTYAAPGLKKLLPRSTPALLFRGKAAGGVRIEITVQELPQPKTAAECRAQALRRAAAKAEGVQEQGATLLYVLKRYGVFDEQHGRAFFVRGVHCFEVHAWVDDKTEQSEGHIRAALAGLKLDDDPGAGLRVRILAGQMGLAPLDPRVLLAAGKSYVEGRKWGPPQPAVGVKVLARARARLKDELEPPQRWELFWYGGRARLATGDAAGAMEWFLEAEKAGLDPERTARAAYDVARAGAVAGRLDEAFAALHRAFEKSMPAGKGQLSKEKELENLRKDPRWEDFWRQRVAGR